MQFIKLHDMMINATKIIHIIKTPSEQVLKVYLEDSQELELKGRDAIEFLQDLEKISATGLSPVLKEFLEETMKTEGLLS